MTSEIRGMDRRNFLLTLGIGAGALAGAAGASALLTACGSSSTAGASSSAGAGSSPASSAPGGGKLRPVKLGWYGGVCEAPLWVAYHEGFFDRAGVQAELVNLGQASAKDALASGKVDAIPGITFEWLKPIESGQDIRVTGALHGGCLRLVAGKGTGIQSLQDLKGKTIGTDQIGGSANSFFAVVLAAAGIDPVKDVTFVAYPGAEFEQALKKGEIAAVAAADPWPYLLVADGLAVEIADNLSGAYKDHFCCAIGMNGGLVNDSPQTAAAVTNAWLSAAKWIGSNVEKTAAITVDNKYVATEAPVAAKLLSTYYWQPSVVNLQRDIKQYAKEFKTTGILEQSTDSEALAKRAFADVTGGDGGINGVIPVSSANPSASSTAAAGYGLSHSQTYQISASQREQLLALACHHAQSAAFQAA